ncbi:MAG TPA: DUF881 domain-containing protein [Nocardioides sp.]|nr:DUF881 domain-containing protein [Nocardioides sp.]
MPEHLDRARTPLLTLITLQSLDEDYQVVSRRRGAAGEEPKRGRTVPVIGVLLLFGLLVTVAAVQTSRDAGVDDASRESLISRITEQRADVAASARRLADLRRANTKAESALTGLGTQLTAAEARVANLGALTGMRAVTGPAIRVTLDNAAYADANSQVRDSDIALLVDGLWAAGAEAITVNGQRLTARTGIRTSGDAIEVNGNGIAPPYTILAIGDTDQMAADFLNSATGQDFVALADQYAFRYDLHDVGQVRLAPAPSSVTRLRYAAAYSQQKKTTKKDGTP